MLYRSASVSRYLFLAMLLCLPLQLRAAEAKREVHPGVDTEYGTLRVGDGVTLQTIVTKPATARGKLPAILFVQWLSCSTVAISEDPRDGWSGMLRSIVRESNAIVWRTEKRGIGSSGGTCATMDYETELQDHREALVALRARRDVDPSRIVVFGGSIGGTYAPFLAADQEVAGVMIWGAGATTWAERTLKFERNALELRGADPSTLAREMSERFAFLDRYLIQQRTPQQIAAQDAALGAVWRRMVGTSNEGQYGRPFAFHQQAHQADWAGAWSRVGAPVLAIYGEYDWFESRDAASLIARIVNAKSQGRASFVEAPRMNHHFKQFANPEDAFHERDGTVNPQLATDVMLKWLKATFSAT